MSVKKRRWMAISAAVAAALTAGKGAQAANYYWEGDNNNAWNASGGFLGTNWSTQFAVNLDPQILPGAADDIFFYATGAPAGPVNTTLGQNFSIRSLTFLASNTDSVNISGPATLTIGAGGITIFGGPNSTNQINANVAVGADQTWTNNVPGFSFNVGGAVSGSSTLSLGGAGSFNFTAANSLTGGLVLTTAGNIVSLTDTAGSAANISSLTLNNGAIFNLDSSIANHATQNRLADNLTVASGGAFFNMLGNGGTATTETVGTLQLNTGATQVNVIGAAGSRLTFGSASIPSISRVVGGTVNFNAATGTSIRLPNVTQTNGIIGAHATIGSITGSFGSQVDWATLDASNNVVPFTNYVTSLNTATAIDNVRIDNPATLNPGTTTINSLYVTGSGGITYPGGTGNTDTLIIGSGGIISNGATPTANVNGNTAQQNTVIIGNQVGDVNGFNHGFITAANGELIITAANGSGVRIASTIKDNGATPVNVTISGNGLVDFGDGNAQANKTSNTYTGITTINGGATLIVNNEPQFGTVPAAFRANEITLNGGILVTTAGFNFNANRGITVGAAGGTLRYTGGSTWNLVAPITGAGGVTFSSLPTSSAGGANTVVVGQPAGKNTYLGPTVFEVALNPGFATFGHVQLGNNDVIPHNSALTVNQLGGAGQIDFNSKSLTVGSLAGNAPIINHNSSLTIGQNGLSTEYSGVIAGSGSITKVGSGMQTFSGINTYSGATIVNGGTLLITGSPTGTGLFTVNSGGSLGGNGTIAAPVTINAGGALAPALNGNTVSNLTINNNLTLVNGASLNFLFGSPGLNDMVTVNGAGKTLTLAAGAGSDVLNINDLPSFGVGTYTLLQATGDAILNDLANFVVNGNTLFNYAVTSTNGANGSVVLNVTPGNPTLVWSGAVNGNWDKTTANWQGGNGIWADTDNAVFDGTGAARPNITVVAGGVKPNSLLFNNAIANYSFSGGAITSTGSFTKNLAGSVTFNNIVSVGVAKINAGTVNVGPTGSLTSPNLTVSLGAILNVNGSLGASTLLQNDGLTNFANTTQTLTALSGGASGIVNLNGPTALTVGSGSYNGIINGVGSSLTVNSADGGGALVLAGVNTYTGPTTVINGTLVAGGNVASGVAGPFGLAATSLLVGATNGAGNASLLVGGPFTITRDIVVQNGNTGTGTIGGSTSDTSTFSNNISLSNTNAATMLAAGASGTVNYTGTLSGPGSVNVVGPGTSVFNGTTATYTGTTLVSGGSLNLPGVLSTKSLSVGSATGGGTFNLIGTGSLTSTNAVTINPGGTFNYSSPTAIAAVPTFNVGGPGTVNAQLTFASGVSYTNAVNVLGAGFVTISATDTANANLITGPINLSNAGGVILMVQQQAAASPTPVNIYNGRINIAGNMGSNGADGILQVRNSGVSTVVGEGIFTNVHLANNASLNFGLAPSAATPRDLIIVDLKIDGTSAFISTNSDGSSPEFVRDISGTNPGSIVNVFAISGTNVPNINSVNAAIPGTFTAVGPKSVNFIGSLNPNITVLNTETAPAGINLTSNTNIASSDLQTTASFFLNGGTFQTGSVGTGNNNTGTTNLTATAASPGTSGTFLITGNGTFNVNRSADATITYQGGTLNINVDQTLTGFNIGDGTNTLSFSMPASNITTGTLNILNAASVTTSFSNLTAGPTRIDGLLTVSGGGIATTGTISGAGQIDLVSEPGLVTGDATSATFSGSITGTASLTKQGSGVWTVSGNNTYTGTTNINAGTLKVNSSIVTSSNVIVNGGFFEAGASQVVNQLTILGTGNAKITPSAHPATPKVLTINTLILGGPATPAVDVTNNAMILENTNLSGVRALLISGRNNGTWNGMGINSSNAALNPSKNAVGYAAAATLLNIAPGGTAPWLDNQIADSSSILVRYTVMGDSNLDGTVDFADLVAVAQHYGSNIATSWQGGDFDYDGSVGFSDLVAVAQNYGGALPSSAIPGAPVNFNNDLAAAFSSVPEPSGLLMIAAGGLLATRVRRRRV